MSARIVALCVVALGGVAAADGPAAPAASAAGPAAAPIVERSRLEVAPGGKAITRIAIDNPLGDVRVEGHDAPTILIETRKVAPDEEALDRLRVSLVPNPDGTVRITTTADGGKELRRVARSAMRIDLIVRAPRDARIEASGFSGAIEVVNMDAGGELDTSSGTISVRNVSGGVSTHSVSGATSLAQVFGSVDAQTLAANVELDTVGGERLIASTNRGKIAGRRVRARHIELTSTEGKIVLEAEAALRGRVMVASLKGDVEVRLRRRGAVAVRARGARVAMGTSIGVAGSDGWVERRFGHGNQPAVVELRSRYGNVVFSVIE